MSNVKWIEYDFSYLKVTDLNLYQYLFFKYLFYTFFHLF